MDISRRMALMAGVFGLPLTAALQGLALGQPGGGQPAAQPTQPGRRPEPPRGLTDAPTALDAPLAACLLIDGRKQIGKCELVRKRLETEEARAFAQAEIEEHEHIGKALAQLGFMYPSAGESRPAATTGNQRAGETLGQVTVGKGTLPAGAGQIIMTEHDVANQCLATFKAIAERKEGLKLDKAFIGDQLHAHYGLWDKAQVFRKHGTAELRPVLDDGLTIIQKHIATLEGIMEKFDQAKS